MVNRNEYSKRKILTDMDEKKTIEVQCAETFGAD